MSVSKIQRKHLIHTKKKKKNKPKNNPNYRVEAADRNQLETKKYFKSILPSLAETSIYFARYNSTLYMYI